MINFIKKFDYFRKVEQDIETHTGSGGIFSILAFMIAIWLFLSEYKSYITPKIETEFTIASLDSQNITAFVNITFFNSPCYILGIDIQDAYSGEHQQNIDGINLKKTRLNEDGDILENDISQKMIDPAYDGSDQEYEDFQKAVQSREMCQITGAFIMQKNPGNFHFSFHSKEDLLEQLKQNRKDLFPQINLDYQINQLFFGNYEQNEIDFEEKSNQMQQSFNSQSLQEKILKQFFNFDKTLYAPYNKLVFLGDQKNEYENYIKILPLNFDYKNVKITKMQQKQMQSYLTDLYQYSMTSTAIPKRSDERTNLYFRYEVSPVNLNYSLKYNTFYHFVVQILAIIGGVFAVLGIVSSNFEDLVQKLKYKIQQPIQLINEQIQK